jgi:hypothetical protein
VINHPALPHRDGRTIFCRQQRYSSERRRWLCGSPAGLARPPSADKLGTKHAVRALFLRNIPELNPNFATPIARCGQLKEVALLFLEESYHEDTVKALQERGEYTDT